MADIRETRMNKNKRLSRSPGVYNLVRVMNIQTSELQTRRCYFPLEEGNPGKALPGASELSLVLWYE